MQNEEESCERLFVLQRPSKKLTAKWSPKTVSKLIRRTLTGNSQVSPVLWTNRVFGCRWSRSGRCSMFLPFAVHGPHHGPRTMFQLNASKCATTVSTSVLGWIAGQSVGGNSLGVQSELPRIYISICRQPRLEKQKSPMDCGWWGMILVDTEESGDLSARKGGLSDFRVACIYPFCVARSFQGWIKEAPEGGSLLTNILLVTFQNSGPFKTL